MTLRDFLLDISSVAACFEGYGHHPLLYIVNQMKPRANTYHTLLGNFAGSALDDIIHENRESKAENILARTLTRNFQEKALEYATCDDFDAQKFKRDALRQIQNIQQAVQHLSAPYSRSSTLRSRALLEPSFVCPALGLQGRIDLMTIDMQLLVEQKSGKNICPQKHYVQALLYYDVLTHNFGLNPDNIDVELLYSKYPLPDSLRKIDAKLNRKLLEEAMTFRDEVAALLYKIANEGFASVYDSLTPETLCDDSKDTFFVRYELPRLQEILNPLHNATPIERAYMERMMTFVIREQIVCKTGASPSTLDSLPSIPYYACVADLWRMPLTQKQEMGNIYTGLHLTDKQPSSSCSGYDLLTFDVPNQGEDFMPNFRRGDMVYLYQTPSTLDTPTINHSILLKGTLTHITTTRVIVQLNNGQQNPDIFDHLQFTSDDLQTPPSTNSWTIEHADSDVNTTAAIQGLHAFLRAPEGVRQLLLAQRQPRRDTTRQLSRHYHPDYDEIVEKAIQSEDYFLLVGPPGTGKTSMALRFLVEESLFGRGSRVEGRESSPTQTSPERERSMDSPALLLLSYTNRAVDEICEMLVQAGLDFIRLGHEYSCEPRFRPYLLNSIAKTTPRLDTLRQRLLDAKIIVATTSTIGKHPHILTQKNFSRIIIDEASQILEPNIIGILSTGIPFILIGDHKQLPAVVQQDAETSAVTNQYLLDIHLDNCRNSLFERLLRIEKAAGRSAFTAILHKQGRMHPDVARFSCEKFYSDELITAVPLQHQTTDTIYPDAVAYDDLSHLLLTKRMLFFPSPLPADIGLSDKVNTEEARIVASLLQHVYQLCFDTFQPLQSVGVIVPYRNQIATIRQAIEQLHIEPLLHITIDTVERFQGSQRDIIIYSFTATKDYQLEFLTSSCFIDGNRTIDRKLNVVLTRARKQILLVGYKPLLETNPIFRELLSEKGGSIDSSYKRQ